MSDADLAFSQIAQTVFPGSRFLRAWPLKGGLSAGMTALEARLPDGQVTRAVVRQPAAGALRQNPRAAEDEFRLLQKLRAWGLAVPEAYHLDTSGALLPGPYLVIEYVEGRPEYAPADLDCFTTQLAGHLARIHALDAARLDGIALTAADFTRLAGPRPAQMDETLGEGPIRDFLEAALPFPRHNAPVLIHGDYWPGNILWKAGQLAAIIDWEDAQFGDPLIDLAISRLDLLWIIGEQAMHDFTRRYLSAASIDDAALPYWDLCAALRLVRLAGAHLAEWAAFFHPYGRTDITGATIRAHYRSFVYQAFERLGEKPPRF